MSRIEVAVAAPLFQTLSYSFDPEENGDPVGRRVLVRLGRQKVTGYVLGLLPEEDVSYKILPVIRFLDKRPLFPENLVSFYRWIASYYHHPIGEVIKTALPGGMTLRSRKVLSLSEGGVKALVAWPVADMAKPDWFEVLIQKKELSPSLSKKVLSDAGFSKLVTVWMDKQLVVIKEVLDKQKTSEKLELCFSKNTTLELPDFVEGNGGNEEYKQAAKQLVDGEKLTIPLIRTLVYLTHLSMEQGQKKVAARDIRKLYAGASKALKELEERGLVRAHKRRVYRNPFGETLAHFPKPDTLSAEQIGVLDTINPAIEKQTYIPFLLHGVTGCGKDRKSVV